MDAKQLKIIPHFDKGILAQSKDFSFLNLASIGNYLDQEKSDINYFCDGMLLAKYFQLVTFKNIKRISFDFTSIAHDVFTFASLNKNTIYIVGAEEHELNAFCDKITLRYPGIEISGRHHGYFSQQQECILQNDILASGARILLVGLGAGKQEHFISQVRNVGFKGVSFTCGGFIRQEAAKHCDYYPHIVNKLKLRAFYRMYKEPHTIGRYIIDYPKNLFKLTFLILIDKLMVVLK